jgi:hypothetical protein
MNTAGSADTILVNRFFPQVHTEAGPFGNLHGAVRFYDKLLFGHLPADRRLAAGIFEQFRLPVSSEEVKIRGDFDVALVAMRNNTLPSPPRLLGNFKNPRKATYVGDIRLPDFSVAAIHSLDEFLDVGKAKIAHAQR